MQLVSRLSVASFACFEQELLRRVKVLVHTESLHVVDTHPVDGNGATTISSNHVIVGGLFLVTFLLGLGVVQFSESCASTG